MFCPKCRSEYREGFYTCADCGVDLVDALLQEPEIELEFIDFEEILATYNPADIAFIKSMLEPENITYFFKGEHFLYLRPLADPVRLMVRKDQAEMAKEILADVDLAFMGIRLPQKSKGKMSDK